VVPSILVNKFISEIYPFSKEEINTYRERIDFKYLSRNKNVKWSYDLVKLFESSWEWSALDQNRAVFSRLTLGLLFPDRIELQECNCFFQMNFCERENCIHNLKKFLDSTSLYDDFPEIFIRMRMFLESGAIDAEMIKSYYNSEDPDSVICINMDINFQGDKRCFEDSSNSALENFGGVDS